MRIVLIVVFSLALIACADTVDGDDNAWNIGDPVNDTETDEPTAGGCFQHRAIDTATIWGQLEDPDLCVEIGLRGDNSANTPAAPDLELDIPWSLTGFAAWSAPCADRQNADSITGTDISGQITSPDDEYTVFTVDVAVEFEDGSSTQWVEDRIETDGGQCDPS